MYFFLGVISLQLDELPVDFFLDINPQKNVVYLLFQVKMLYCIHHLLLKKSQNYIFSVIAFHYVSEILDFVQKDVGYIVSMEIFEL